MPTLLLDPTDIAFVTAVAADPRDSTRSLALADWFQDRGLETLAGVIRKAVRETPKAHPSVYREPSPFATPPIVVATTTGVYAYKGKWSRGVHLSFRGSDALVVYRASVVEGEVEELLAALRADGVRTVGDKK